MNNLSFYINKKVLITGHTGFKGTWLTKTLLSLGANVVGYSLQPPTSPSLFEILKVQKDIHSINGDIRDKDHLLNICLQEKPELIFHLAAQPLVRESYQNPVYTYETNVMGTVHIMEAVRTVDSVKAFLNVTTDKVYKNREWEWGYRENEELNGFDPYSNSKSCSELVTDCYKNSFLLEKGVAISTARAGNVIGGGDFAADRIIPDCIRSALGDQDIVVRNPYSTRPFQHVLEPVFAYLLLNQAQYENVELAGNYNIGPKEDDCITTEKLVTLFCENWYRHTGKKIQWINQHDGGPHEASFLKLDCSKIKKVLQWEPGWNIMQAVDKTIEWTNAYAYAGEAEKCVDAQIKEYLTLVNKGSVK